ncbi:MAG: molybdopterin-dependent oxidoreductase [Deltaproteobacteria bacterium]|nr:molybdopterin-dependent oxidoreductase [Deltaproteobacteria bacterium]
MTPVGTSVQRIDGLAKVTGQAAYTDDLLLPGMLHGRLLRSPHPHARIRHIETRRARALPGVRAVLTGADVPGARYGTIPDEQGLASDKVRFVGDEVAAVAAVDPEAAAEALDLIAVEYEVLPPVLTPEEAMAEGAPLVHEDRPGNVSRVVRMHCGDVGQGLAEADQVFTHTFETQVVNHCPVEPHAVVATWDAAGKLTVWSPTQTPFLMQRTLAEVLGLPLHRVRVVKPAVGGAFGGKREVLGLDFAAAVLARATGRPVKIVNDREEEFATTRQRHAMRITLTTGVRRDGTLVAKDCRVVMDNGAYNGRGPDILSSCPGYVTLLYRVPHVRFHGLLVYTNNPPGSAMRGFGNPQIRFADDSQMDIIAQALGLSPLEIRLRNARATGDVTPNRCVLTSCGLRATLEAAAARSGFAAKWRRLPRGRGIGMACGHHTCGFKSLMPHDASSAAVRINEDGTVHVASGGADVGQGLDTVLAQIAAAEIGVPLELVTMTTADTETTPFDLGSYGSRGTFIAGNAVRLAAAEAKRKLLAVAGDLLEADPADLETGGGRIWVRGSPGRAIPVAEAARAALHSARGEPVMGEAYYNPPSERLDRETGMGNVSPAYSFATQVAEVEVDEATGTVRVLRVTAAVDGGTPINPAGVEGQLEGSIVMGLGQALLEGFATRHGVILNPSMLEYKVPQASDAPHVETLIVNAADPGGPFGAKGVGEFALVPTLAAIANAIYDAVGVRITSLPITPEKLLAALRETGRTGPR